VEKSTDAQGSEPVASRSKAPSTIVESISSGKKASNKAAGKVGFEMSTPPYSDNGST